MKRYAELYLQTRKALLQKEGDQSGFLARELLAVAAGQSVEYVLAHREFYASEEIEQRLQRLTTRFLQNEPLAYLAGHQPFHGMDLLVTPDVLIPRDDTEIVVELALFAGKQTEKARILDLCTGSGCIGLALAKALPDAHVTMGDISPGALRVARENTKREHLTGRVSALRLDAMKPATPFLGQFDLIVSNPPYVTSREMLELEPSVRDYEPELALHGGADGLDFYQAILTNYHSALRPGGWVAFEFGKGQEEAVRCLLQAHRFAVEIVKQDLGGIPRAVLARDTREEWEENGIEETKL